MVSPPPSRGLHRLSRPFSSQRGMTLIEVLVSMLVLTAVAMSVFLLGRQNMRRSLNSAYRAEAYRIAERIAEHAMTLPLASFTPTGVATSQLTGLPSQWVWTDTETSQIYLTTLSNTSPALSYSSNPAPVVFRKSLSTSSSPGKSVVLNITLTWTYAGNASTITLPVARGI